MDLTAQHQPASHSRNFLVRHFGLWQTATWNWCCSSNLFEVNIPRSSTFGAEWQDYPPILSTNSGSLWCLPLVVIPCHPHKVRREHGARRWHERGLEHCGAAWSQEAAVHPLSRKAMERWYLQQCGDAIRTSPILNKFSGRAHDMEWLTSSTVEYTEDYQKCHSDSNICWAERAQDQRQETWRFTRFHFTWNDVILVPVQDAFCMVTTSSVHLSLTCKIYWAGFRWFQDVSGCQLEDVRSQCANLTCQCHTSRMLRQVEVGEQLLERVPCSIEIIAMHLGEWPPETVFLPPNRTTHWRNLNTALASCHRTALDPCDFARQWAQHDRGRRRSGWRWAPPETSICGGFWLDHPTNWPLTLKRWHTVQWFPLPKLKPILFRSVQISLRHIWVLFGSCSWWNLDLTLVEGKRLLGLTKSAAAREAKSNHFLASSTSCRTRSSTTCTMVVRDCSSSIRALACRMAAAEAGRANLVPKIAATPSHIICSMIPHQSIQSKGMSLRNAIKSANFCFEFRDSN